MLSLLEDIVEGIVAVVIIALTFAFVASPLILFGWLIWVVAN